MGGSTIYTEDPSDPDRCGFMVVLDLDDQKGAESGGTKEDATKVTISDITVKARTLVADASGKKPGEGGYQYTYLKVATGDFNLATGHWNVLADGNTTTTPENATNGASTTTHQITTDGVAGTLAESIAEPTTAPAKTADGFDGLPVGVLTTPKNVYKDEAYPLVYIPETWPELTVTVTYIVRTKDANLKNAYSEVKQTITKRVTFKDAVELNKQYSLLMHLGLTSVKFTASVSNWEIDNDDPNYDSNGDGDVDIEVTDVYVPINVATAAAAVNAASAYEYTPAYTPKGTMTTDGANISYTLSDASTAEEKAQDMMNDLARFLGALYRVDNGTTVSSIEYGGKSYTWQPKDDGTYLKGSNWRDSDKNTLVSKITADYTSSTLTLPLTLTINGQNDADHTITFSIVTP